MRMSFCSSQIVLPSHDVGACLQTPGEITNLFGKLHWLESFCEYFSQITSHLVPDTFTL